MKISKLSNVSSRKNAVFRKFTRKPYAVFNSMHRYICIGTLGFAYTLIVSPVRGQSQTTDTLTFSKVLDLGEVEVVGEKNPTLFEKLPRVVSLVTEKEISKAPSESIDDLLRYTGNIDVRQRGKDGTQADLSIRGGSFDQTMVLFNGVNISDPQTGHLSLFLPVDITALNNIEVLNGPAARVYGANAFSGAVNFTTRPADKNDLQLSVSGGKYGFFKTAGLVNLAKGKTRNLFTASFDKSNGQYSDTDFKHYNLFYQGQLLTKEGMFDFELGYADRAFGANGFYTPAYPDQFEENKMTFASLSYKTGKKIHFQSKIYWRRHRDRFELFREGAAWYTITDTGTYSNNPSNTHFNSVSWYTGHNHHINDVFGVKGDIRFHSVIGKSLLGWELRSENIISTNIGYDKSLKIPVRGYPGTYYTRTDSRTNFNLYGEQVFSLGSLNLTAGTLVNWNSYLPDEINAFPGVDVHYAINKDIALIGSFNYTLGLPTFTDLTYHDPNNQGSVNLKPYTQNSWEGGIRWGKGTNLISAVGFYTEGKGIIDWVWFSNSGQFKPVNTVISVNKGFEFSAVHDFTREMGNNFIIQSVRLNYTYINVHKKIPSTDSTANNLEKYNNPKNMISAMLQLKFPGNLSMSWDFSYMERAGSYLSYDFANSEYSSNAYKPYTLVDTRLEYTFHQFTVYGEVTNLFDTKYIDVGSIYQPGRCINGGLVFRMSDF